MNESGVEASRVRADHLARCHFGRTVEVSLRGVRTVATLRAIQITPGYIEVEVQLPHKKTRLTRRLAPSTELLLLPEGAAA